MVQIRSCSFDMSIFEETPPGSLQSSQEATYSYLTIDAVGHNIIVSNTKNSDFPTTPQALYDSLIA